MWNNLRDVEAVISNVQTGPHTGINMQHPICGEKKKTIPFGDGNKKTRQRTYEWRLGAPRKG